MNFLRQSRRYVSGHVTAVSWGLAQGFQRSIATRLRASEPGRSEGMSKYRRLPPSSEPSGVSAQEQGRIARILSWPVQLSASLAMGTLASVFAFTPWRMVEAELYTHPQPPTVNLGARRSTSARAEFR